VTGLDVVNAGILEPALAGLPLSLLQTEQMLESCGLAPTLAHEPRGVIPLYAAKKFLCQVNLKLGDPNFGFDMVYKSSLQKGSDGIANIPLPDHQSGLDAAKEFVGKLDNTLTGTRYFWTLEGNTFWILRTAFGAEMSERWAIVQYNLSIVLSGMQKIYGSDLSPVAARTGSLPFTERRPEVLFGVPLQHGPERAGVGFDTTELFRRTDVQQTRLRPMAPTPFQPLEALNETFLSACLLNFLQEGSTDKLVTRAASAFGLTDRTYQRRLAEMGTSHSRLRDNARMSVAFDKLCDSSQSILSVSLDLGYANAGDFTRFFRRRSGLTPSQYRRMI
jgi:AraC-like DNA-binding protein